MIIKSLFMYCGEKLDDLHIDDSGVDQDFFCDTTPLDAPDDCVVVREIENFPSYYSPPLQFSRFVFTVRNSQRLVGREIAKSITELFTGMALVKLVEVNSTNYQIFSCESNNYRELNQDDKLRYRFQVQVALNYEVISNG